MKVYDDKHIKNVVLVGASKSGKTTLAEAMLFEAGLINRRGTVEEKNTLSDYHEIEHDRGNSVYATSMHTEWRDYKINIIDTPGLDDFIGELISSLRVADTAVMLLNGENGVEVGTELIWNYVEKFQKPIIFAEGSLGEDELREGLKLGMLHHDVYPVFCLSAKKDMGSARLMGFIDNVAASATDLLPEVSTDGKELECDPKGPAVLFVFKTL